MIRGQVFLMIREEIEASESSCISKRMDGNINNILLPRRVHEQNGMYK